MRKIAFLTLIIALFQSCSLLQRQEEDGYEDEPTVAENRPKPAEAGLESEVAQLNTKIAALETKLDVLSAGMERIQMQRSQPVIEAEEMKPQTNMAAPVDVESSVAAAPERPQTLPETAKSSVPATSSETEKEFRASMELFQRGKNLEAASRFAIVAKKYPRHLLASHALYWAGEASARAQQWTLAIQNWEDLEKYYPRSAYLPDALAGMARAHENQGNTERARAYRDTLMQSFPRAPVALSMQTASKTSSAESAIEEATPPTYSGDSSDSGDSNVEEQEVD